MPSAGAGWRGVYRFDGDDLTLCLNLKGGGEEPAEFATRKGSPFLLLTLKRMTDPAEPSPERVEALVRQVKEERERLTGVWVADRPVRNPPLLQGSPANNAMFDRIRITADTVTLLRDTTDAVASHPYRIDPTTPTKAIDFLPDPSLIPKLPPGTKLGYWRGIYQLDGDRLTVCLGVRARPREFAGNEEAGVCCVTLKRQKPAVSPEFGFLLGLFE
jgi:uncharacterized protein (TIGR03067 family)